MSELLNKYKAYLAPLLKCKPEELRFLIGDKVVVDFDYDKEEVEITWDLGTYRLQLMKGEVYTTVST